MARPSDEFGAVVLLSALALLRSGCAFVARVSDSTTPTSTDPTTASGASDFSSVSGDGRYVAFESAAPTLTRPMPTGSRMSSSATGRAARSNIASVATSGAVATGPSFAPAISDDGRFVAFESDATNLASGDSNAKRDVFLRDRRSGTTSRVSVTSGGVQGNGQSLAASISADGRYVAFTSDETNLVVGDTNASSDVFVRDVQASTTTRVSVAAASTQGDSASFEPSISGDGRLVAFASNAANLVTGDTNGAGADVFVRDLQADATTIVDLSSAGVQSNAAGGSPSISGDGRVVAFRSNGSNLTAGDTNALDDVFVRDRQTNVTDAGERLEFRRPGIRIQQRAVDQPRRSLRQLHVLGAGSRGQRHERRGGCVPPRSDDAHDASDQPCGVGAQPDNSSLRPAISGDGLVVGFTTFTTNLARDGNGSFDVFVRLPGSSSTDLVSRFRSAQGDSTATEPAMSGDGRYVAFSSFSSNLVPGDSSGVAHVYVRDVLTGSVERGASALPGCRGTPAAPGRRSAPTAGTSRSNPTQTTWSQGTPTTSPTCSCAIGRRRSQPA